MSKWRPDGWKNPHTLIATPDSSGIAYVQWNDRFAPLKMVPMHAGGEEERGAS